MTDNEPKPRSSLAVAVIVVIVLPIAYALSTGPAVMLRDNGYVPDMALVVYWPIEMLCRNCQPVKEVFQFYLALWGHTS